MAPSDGGVPPGFRFHPTEEELLHYYLKKKVTFQKFELEVIREVNLNKMEPWDLQERCTIGATPQNEWYFFSHKDRKYPTGSRTNRATNGGFWKATGRDKCIRNSNSKIGMRKTLVFYRGRAPHGHKTDWIMHEYRLEGNDDEQTNAIDDGWVICRVFKKKLFKVSNIESSSSLYAVGNHPSSTAIANYQQALTLGDHHADHGHHGDMQTCQEHGLHHYHPLSVPNDTNTGQIYLHCRGDGPRPPPFYDFPAFTGDQSSPAMVRQLLATMGRGSESDPAQQMVNHGREEAGLGSDWPLLVTMGQITSHPNMMHLHAGSPDKPALFRGEINLWGYGK